MVYPNSVITNAGWYESPTGYGILLALGENDNAHVLTNTFGSVLRLGLPQTATDCQLRVRGDSEYIVPVLLLTFWSGANPVATHVVELYDQWQEVELSVPYWDEVEVVAETNDYAAIDYLRGYPFGGLPTRRLLTGVGV